MSEIETIVKNALNTLSKEIIGKANKTVGYFKREYENLINYPKSKDSYEPLF